MLRIELDRKIEVGHRTFAIALGVVRYCAIVENVGVLRTKRRGAIVVADRLVELALLLKRERAEEKRFRVLGIEHQRVPISDTTLS